MRGMMCVMPSSSAGSARSEHNGRAKVFVVGLGLIGGSLGMALRASGRYTVDGFDIEAHCLDRALALGAIDRAAKSLDGAAGADLVVVATPLFAMPLVFAELGRHLRGSRGCHEHAERCKNDREADSGSEGKGEGDGKGAASRTVVTDVGGAKGYVILLAREHLAPDVPFVGGHPMAGSEHEGIEHATEGLLRGCHYVLTPAEWADDCAVQAVKGACEAAGAVPQVVDPDDHDGVVAATSHLPLVVAACLAQVAGKRAAIQPSIWDLASGGFRDTTRVASGNPEMGAGMLVANAARVLDALGEFQCELDEVRRLIAEALRGADTSGPGAVRDFLSQARASRQAWLDRERLAGRAQDRGEAARKGGACAWASPMH